MQRKRECQPFLKIQILQSYSLNDYPPGLATSFQHSHGGGCYRSMLIIITIINIVQSLRYYVTNITLFLTSLTQVGPGHPRHQMLECLRAGLQVD